MLYSGRWLRRTLSALFERERCATYGKMQEVNDPSFEERIAGINYEANEGARQDGDWGWLLLQTLPKQGKNVRLLL